MSFKTSSAKATLAALAFSITALSGQSAIAETKSAYFAGGCFWCIEKDFENVDGVKEVESGYQGGEIENPTYRNHPGYIESVRIDYDPAAINYAQLLKIFFRTVDPTDAGGQFCDRGHAYTTAIFAGNAEETKLANAAIAEAGAELGQDIATVVRGDDKFWKSEDYHQNYYKKNPVRYKYYRFRCGRDQTVNKLWGDQAYLGVNH
jgi:peptide-methionine (S)-S-oxide reductase